MKCQLSIDYELDRKDELQMTIKGMKSKIVLGSSLYDYAFWKLYTCHNPLEIYAIKMKIFMTMLVHGFIVVSAFYARSEGMSFKEPNMADIQMNFTRLFCCMLLHL